MAKPKGYKRLLVFCLLVFTLCADASFAGKSVGRCGPPAGRGARDVSRCGPPAGWGARDASRCGPPAGWGARDVSRCGPPAGWGARDVSRCGPPAGRGARDVSRCGPPAGWGVRDVSRCGPSAGWGVRREPFCQFYPSYSRFQSQPVLIDFPYIYQYGVNFDTRSRYDNFPNPSNYDDYRSRYDNFPYSSQAQSSPPQGNTYNYYTYNYYGSAEGSAAQYGSTPYQRSTPQKSEVGIYYENGAVAFKDGDYAAAAENFQHAIRQANKFMPFAYTQSLFAGENYTQAIEQLRLAIGKISPENDSILFPSFLYPSNQILLTQVEKLRRQANTDSDLQLLVGYQLFGVKKMDEAVTFLNKAKSNSVNEPAATKLLLMIEKTRTATNS
jgi:hypothetical protein